MLRYRWCEEKDGVTEDSNSRSVIIDGANEWTIDIGHETTKPNQTKPKPNQNQPCQQSRPLDEPTGRVWAIPGEM
jgi:hypothetical protein